MTVTAPTGQMSKGLLPALEPVAASSMRTVPGSVGEVEKTRDPALEVHARSMVTRRAGERDI